MITTTKTTTTILIYLPPQKMGKEEYETRFRLPHSYFEDPLNEAMRLLCKAGMITESGV